MRGIIWLAGTLGTVVLVASACATTEEKSAATQQGAATQPAVTEEGEATTTESAPEADPDAKYTSNCDYLLESNFYNFTSSHAGWFVADARVHNTGNIGVVSKATASWKQAGS